MKRPSFQFYPADWSTDLALRRCSPAARGIWMDVLCALHKSDDAYGILRWPLKEIASTIGAPMAQMRELVEKGVLKGSDKEISAALIYVPKSGRKEGAPVTLIDTQPGPLWYSKRLVKDEYIRTIRGESTRFGADDGAAPKVDVPAAPKPPFGDGTTSPSSSPPSGSVPDGTGGLPPPTDLLGDGASAGKTPKALTPEQEAKAAMWRSAASLLASQGMDVAAARTFIGKLKKDFPGDVIVPQAIAAAIAEQPAEAKAWLVARCQLAAGQRQVAELPSTRAAREGADILTGGRHRGAAPTPSTDSTIEENGHATPLLA